MNISDTSPGVHFKTSLPTKVVGLPSPPIPYTTQTSNPLTSSAYKSAALIAAPPFHVKYDWQNDSFIIIVKQKIFNEIFNTYEY